MVKTCSKCGCVKEISEFHKCSRNKSGLSGRCKGCSSNYYSSNKDHYKKVHKEYYNNNRIKVNEYKKLWERTDGRDTVRKKDQNLINKLSDCYIKSKLRRRGFTNEIINASPELIQAAREIIKIKRYVKEKNGKKHSGA